jgi:hypothetical protein
MDVINPNKTKADKTTKLYPKEVSLKVPEYLLIALIVVIVLEIIGIILVFPYEDDNTKNDKVKNTNMEIRAIWSYEMLQIQSEKLELRAIMPNSIVSFAQLSKDYYVCSMSFTLGETSKLCQNEDYSKDYFEQNSPSSFDEEDKIAKVNSVLSKKKKNPNKNTVETEAKNQARESGNLIVNSEEAKIISKASIPEVNKELKIQQTRSKLFIAIFNMRNFKYCILMYCGMCK